MTVQRRYERKVRIALGVLVVLLLAGPVLALRNCVSNLQTQNQLVAPVHASGDDRLVKLRNGSTMLLDQGSISPKVIHWLQLQTDDRTAFEIADTNFIPGSADPAAGGLDEISQIVQILNADPQVHAEVVVDRDPARDGAALALERSRAVRIGAELFRQGVSRERISVTVQPDSVLAANHVIDHPGQESGLFIVLSR